MIISDCFVGLITRFNVFVEGREGVIHLCYKNGGGGGGGLLLFAFMYNDVYVVIM